MKSLKDVVLNFVKMNGNITNGASEVKMCAAVGDASRGDIRDALASLVAEGSLFKFGDNVYSTSSEEPEKLSDFGVDAQIYIAKVNAIKPLALDVVSKSIEVESAEFVLDKIISNGANGIELCHVIDALKHLNATGFILKSRGNCDGSGGYVFRG